MYVSEYVDLINQMTKEFPELLSAEVVALDINGNYVGVEEPPVVGHTDEKGGFYGIDELGRDFLKNRPIPKPIRG